MEKWLVKQNVDLGRDICLYNEEKQLFNGNRKKSWSNDRIGWI